MYMESPRSDLLVSTDRSRLNLETFHQSPSHHYHQSLLSSPSLKNKASKRRISDDYSSPKKNKTQLHHNSPTKGTDYPVFQLPNGGIIQQTPYGNIRIVKDGQTETATIDKSVTLDTFMPLSPSLNPSSASISHRGSETPRSDRGKTLPSPSPSCEVETYMIEGYRDQNMTNDSYNHHVENIVGVNYNLYDQCDEDSHLDDDENDLDMIL